MGLLAALDHHYENSDVESEEIEYRLITWGEIYPPFLGNREHSLAAQFILTQLPFKLFSVSTPHSELPQKLCLSFHPPPLLTHETKYLSGTRFYIDEIAKEFSAFLSIITRRRVFTVGLTRVNGLPIEESVNIYQRHHFQEKQSLREIQPSEIYALLGNLQAMDRRLARSFILAMRLYHSAVEMMFTEPEFSYLFLVMSLEAISSVAYEDVSPSGEGDGRTELDQFLDSSYPGWRRLCDISTPDRRVKVIKMLLTKAYFTRRRFREFVIANLPEVFWSELEDDAKPNYPHADVLIRDWEKIKRKDLKRTLDNIYQARSELVHQGNPLPRNIVIGHFALIPPDLVEFILEPASAENNPMVNSQIPPLITFERLVSYCMVEFLRKQTPRQQPDNQGSGHMNL
jgi:hypothetical protein